jgi:hypothetical protein
MTPPLNAISIDIYPLGEQWKANILIGPCDDGDSDWAEATIIRADPGTLRECEEWAAWWIAKYVIGNEAERRAMTGLDIDLREEAA